MLLEARRNSITNVRQNLMLTQWFEAARAQGILITGEILKNKAEEELNNEMGCAEWTCSSGWILHRKVLNNI